MMLLLAPIAGALCFFAIWLAVKLGWSRSAVAMICAVLIGTSMAAYFAEPVTGLATSPLVGLILGSALGAAIGWAAFGAASDALQRRQGKSDSTTSSAASNPEDDRE
jgi:hypothetical protein